MGSVDWAEDDDDLDFLVRAPSPAEEAAAALERVRADLLDWGAGALVARHPQITAYHGPKGRQKARQDLDLHLRHLHDALLAGTTELGTYVRWVGPLLAQRGLGRHDVTAGLDLLQEAVRRFVPAPWDRAVIAPISTPPNDSGVEPGGGPG